MNPVIDFDSKLACKNCSLDRLCLSIGLSGRELDKLERLVRRNHPLHRNDRLFNEGEPFENLYVVKTGTIKSCVKSETGEEQIIGFHLPGEFIGFDAIEGGYYTSSAVVLETSAVCELPFAKLSELAQAIPSLQQQLFKLLSKEIVEESRMLAVLGHKNAEERLAAFLASLSCRFERRGFSPYNFYLSMSRHEIGNHLGLAVETISRLLTRFQEQGLIRANRKHIELLDVERIHQMAGNDTCSQHKRQAN